VKVLYLINTFPSVSLTFIRREILALEKLGVEVTRVSVRSTTSPLFDPADVEDAHRTTVLLQRGMLGLLPDTITALLRHPRRFFATLGTALRLARASETGLVRHLAYFAEACMVARMAARLGVAHLHAHFSTNATAVALLAHELGGPTFSFTHHNLEDDAQGRRLKIAEKIAAARFTVAVSEFGRKQLMHLSDPAHHARIHVVHCGLDPAFFEDPVSPPPDVSDLLFIGRLCKEKQPLFLVDAAARLAAEGVPFRIRVAGSGELEADMIARIASHGIHDHFVMLGSVDGATVRRELEACRALLLPSRSEGLPLVVMEALARQRPVLSTFVAGIPELVRDGQEGWLVAPDDVEGLKNAMKTALQAPPAELLRLGQSGVTRVHQRHHVDDSARMLRSLFEDQLSESAPVRHSAVTS